MRLTKAQLLDAALEAIDYVGQLNHSHRERTAMCWLERMWDGKTDMSLDEVSNELEEAYERAGSAG